MQVGQFLSQYATPEVLSVFGTLAACWVGYKVAGKGYGMLAGAAKKMSFMGLASALLVMGGLGATGFGVGELRSRPDDVKKTAPANLTNADLMKIATASDKIPLENLKAILAYAEQRDQRAKVEPKFVKYGVPVRENGVVIQKLKLVGTDNPDKAEPYAGYESEVVAIDPVKESAIRAEESIVPIPWAWTSIGLGIAASLSGFAVFANRHNARNQADPHHPNYRA